MAISPIGPSSAQPATGDVPSGAASGATPGSAGGSADVQKILSTIIGLLQKVIDQIGGSSQGGQSAQSTPEGDGSSTDEAPTSDAEAQVSDEGPPPDAAPADGPDAHQPATHGSRTHAPPAAGARGAG